MKAPNRAKPKKSIPTRHGRVSSKKVNALIRELIKWYSASARDLPWRRTRDPYAIWVSEIMLQQTQVATVIPYYERWMKALPTIESLARVSASRLHKLWEGLGYYTRVRNLKRGARVICKEHGGRFPHEFTDVLTLPGIGRYTAGAICSIAFNQPTPILDGNVIRVLTRVFGIATDPKETNTNTRLWQLAERLVSGAARHNPQPSIHNGRSGALPCSALNQSLMELGATLCVPRNPLCSQCPIRRHCIAHLQRMTDQIPHRTVRAKSVERRVCIVVAQDRDRFWALRRSPGSLNGGLWEFPRLDEIENTSIDSQSNLRRLRKPPAHMELLGTFKQGITKFRVTAKVFLCRNDLDKLRLEKPGRWLSVTALQTTPFSAMHRKIANRLVNREQPSDRPVPRRRSRRELNLR